MIDVYMKKPVQGQNIDSWGVTKHAHDLYQKALKNVAQHQFYPDKTEIPFEHHTTPKHKNTVSFATLVANLQKATSQYQMSMRILKEQEKMNNTAAA